MMPLIKTALTSKDNETWDIVRIGMAATILFILVGSIVAMVLHEWQWNPLQLGGATAAALGGGGAGIGMKSKDEPAEKPSIISDAIHSIWPISTGGEP
ncbi:MAG: hypothetical protein ACYC46_15940 [Acidobacteriaceae bacterium]